LYALGVETLYVSPITRARPGSTHGYDVVDPTVLDPALGTRGDFDNLLRVLDEHDMRLLIDIVPNHMAATADNPYFADVLRRGRDSPYAGYFDIDWERGGGQVVLCVIDGPLIEALDAGALKVVTPPDDPSYQLGYGDLRFPLATTELDAASADLTELLALQHYRLTDWRLANRETNYRRFFDITDLIGVRQEDAFVFAATHGQVVELAADHRVGGVRVDHVDGLADPGRYLVSLRAAVPVDTALLVEKIVERDERLPPWPVDGTTGYEFATAVTGLFVDPAGAEAIRVEELTVTGDARRFGKRATDAKRDVLRTLFVGAFDRVVELMSRALPDTDPELLWVALSKLTVHLAVYRTYRTAGETASSADLAQLHAAAGRASRELDDEGAAALRSLVELLTGDLHSGSDAMVAVTAWQQLTPPVMAKGVEDTAIYHPGSLLSAADVGSDPDRPATSPAEFHQAMELRQRLTPRALSALSTHDSKRSHDVRCRLAALSEIAEMWAESVAALDKEATNADLDPAERRYVYQTLVGTWPISGEINDAYQTRIREHLVKAAREAKRHSSWIDPDLEHEQALGDFAGGLVSDPASVSVEILETLVTDLEYAGATNALSAVALRSCAPGVPDIYQNDDSWFLALVDPDNRSAVDPDRLAPGDLAAEVPGPDLLTEWRDGRVKRAVIRAGLRLRRERPTLFALGAYRPITAAGESAEHVVAFERRYGDESVVCVAPRLPRTLSGPGRFPVGELWRDTELALPAVPGGYVDALSGHRVAAGGHVPLSLLLATVPVAMLRSSR
jgi:malto-oligosyltrehalose synthase